MGAHRLASIQRLRGLAALLVVIVHGFDLVDPLTDPGRRAIVERFWLIDDLGASGVDLFFVISGFVMALGIGRLAGGDGWRRFLTARARRILPLFWLLSALFAARIVAGGGGIDGRAVANTITLLPLLDGRDYHLPPLWLGWTLAFECGFYVLVAIASRWSRPLPVLLALTIGLGLAGIAMHPGWAAARVLANPILLEFALGVGVFLLWRRGIPAGAAAAALAVGVVLLVGLRAARPDLIFSPQAGLVIDGSTSLVRVMLWGVPWALVVLGSVCGERRGGADALTRLGDASYALYLTHAFVLAEAMRWDVARLLDPRLTVPLFVSVSVAAGFAVHRWLEVPLGRRLAGLQPSRSAFSASTVSPLSVTSAKPPSTRMRPVTVLIDE